MTWYVIDGMDGSGKSTIADRLRRILESEGRTVSVFTHPDRSRTFGRISARFLLSDGVPAAVAATVFYLLDIVSSLAAMRRVGSDDFVFVRYSLAAAYLPARLYRIGYRIIDGALPSPDMRIFVDVGPDTALERIDRRGEDREMFETRERLEKTRGRMRELAEGWTVIDNSSDPDHAEKQLRKALEAHTS